MKNFLLLIVIFTSNAFAFTELAFDLADLSKAQTKEDCEVSGPVLPEKDFENIERFIREKEELIVIKPMKMETLGISPEQALAASRDGIQTNGCSAGHDQGDLANRWCHSALARTFASVLEKSGVNHGVAAIAGGVFWAPKEFFYDLHPSSGDFSFTYQDKLGTKRTTFEVTVYGDAIWEHRPFEKVRPFKESTPFITIRRKLGPQ